MPRARLLGLIAAAVLLLALPYLAEVSGQRAFVGLVTRVLIYAVAVAGLNLILGYGGLVSFGHAAFFGMGNYIVGMLYFHHMEETLLFGFVPGSDQILLTVPAAVIASGIAALLIGLLALRTGGVQFIMITLAFAQMLYFFFVSLKTYGGEDGIIIRRGSNLLGLDLRDKNVIYYVVLAGAAIYFAILWRIVNSSFGAVLSAIRQDERRVTSLGVNVFHHKLVAFVLAGMSAGFAGALLAIFMRYSSPDTLHWMKSGEFMVMVILGGMGTFLGPIWGSGIFLVVQSYLASFTEYWQPIMGALLLALVLGTHGGIQGLVDRIWGTDKGERP